MFRSFDEEKVVVSYFVSSFVVKATGMVTEHLKTAVQKKIWKVKVMWINKDKPSFRANKQQ